MESNNLTEKLNTFTSLVLKDAEQKREKLLENVQKEYSERIDAKENELLQGAYENIQQNIQSAQKSANARAKIVEFIESDKYEEWLLSKIEKALFEVGKGSKTIYISSDDIKLKEKIEQIPDTSRITVEASGEKDFLGGAKVLNTDRKVAVDYSFKEMLSEEKQKFLQSSGLALG